MNFYYVAIQSNGQTVKGHIEAGSSVEVLEWMASQGLKPISVKALKGLEIKGLQSVFGQSINISDKVFLTKYLALMLRVGTDLFHAIDILISDFDKAVVKAFLIEVRENLRKGRPFYTTFLKYQSVFSPVFVNLIKAGESSGSLEKVFGDLSESLEKEKDLRNKIKSALVYPIILLVMAFIIMILMAAFILPRIANAFAETNVDPPFFSRIVFGVGLFIGNNILIILPLMVGAIFGLWYFLFKTDFGNKIFTRFINKVPVISVLLQRIALQRFAATFASLLKAGLPITESLETTADAVGSEELKSALLRISREGILKGVTVGESFRKEPYFPKVVVNLIAVSEKAGHMEEVLETLSDFYTSEIDSSIKMLVAFLEPVLLLFIGLVVGVLAVSIIAPIYQLVTVI
ncbi:MAG: type II secretion system F family protein [Candidatus Liptonbacteria bacterium]|nr:type II secretion system F family protein [Candidatus Liptonbacteria bacterium]